MRERGRLGRAARIRQKETLRAFAEGLSGPFAFCCECADAGCREFVLVEAADVYAVRANPRRLVMANGHDTDRDRTVLKYASYLVVEVVAEA